MGLGNQWVFHEAYTGKQYVRDIIGGGIFGGAAGGIAAGIQGNNIWSGAPKAIGATGWTPPGLNKTLLSEQGWYRNSAGIWKQASVEIQPMTGVFEEANPQTGEYKTFLDDFKGTSNVAEYYPRNNGALGKWESKFLMPGTEIDRFGSGFGKYFSPRGTPIDMRALPSGNTGEYNIFKVIKPFEVQSSTIAPAFGKLGLGTQYLSPVNVNTLLERGIIIKIK